jgi:hypothetical protein
VYFVPFRYSFSGLGKTTDKNLASLSVTRTVLEKRSQFFAILSRFRRFSTNIWGTKKNNIDSWAKFGMREIRRKFLKKFAPRMCTWNVQCKQGLILIQGENPNLGIFLLAFEWKMLVYFVAIWNILRLLQPFAQFCGNLV